MVVVVLSSPAGAPAGGEEEMGLGTNPGEPPNPFPTKLGQSPAPLWDTGVCSSALAVSFPPGLLPQACYCRSVYIKMHFPYVDLASKEAKSSSIKPIHAGCEFFFIFYFFAFKSSLGWFSRCQLGI